MTRKTARRQATKLTPRQERFVAEYLVDQNGKQAAIRAGYAPGSAEVRASALLRLSKVRDKIAARLEKHLRKVDLRAEDVLRAIERHVKADGRSDARDYFDAAGNLKAITDLSGYAATNLGGFEVVKQNLVSGDGKVDQVLKIRFRDQSKYVEMGAKHFALLEERLHLTTDAAVLATLEAGRQRVAAYKKRHG